MKHRNVTLVTIFLAVAWFALAQIRAVSPAPDGCYPNYTTAEGCNALKSLSTGAGNTGVGWYSLYIDTTGNFNTGLGGGALALNNADSNTAVGAGALLLNTIGEKNTATGTDALVYNDSGGENTADGAFALFNNTTGFSNTAVGESALFSNTTGDQNTAVGQAALSANIDGDHNAVIGQFAMFSNDHGEENTASGYQALALNTGGTFNTGTGSNALFSNTTGQSNTAVGYEAGFNQDTGSNNVYIGAGMFGVAGESSHTYIRNINFTSVSGGNADSVTVDLTTGLLGHASSSRRYKEDIQPMDKASEALYRLNPVTYRYKSEIDPTQSPAFGLVAEEVAEVNPELVAYSTDGQPESVHYEMINAMLLNEFLKEHRKNEEQQLVIAELKRQLRTVNARLEQQAARIQEVSAQVKMGKTLPQIVNNP